MMHIHIGNTVKLKGADPEELGEVIDIEPDECLVKVCWEGLDITCEGIWYKNKELLLISNIINV